MAARLVTALGDVFPGSVHVGDVGLLGATDAAIWGYAGSEGYALVTKDTDFHRLSALHGPPPKVIGVRLGNCSTADVAQLLRDHYDEIAASIQHVEAGFLALA